MTIVRSGLMNLGRMIEKMTVAPARILRLKKGTLSEGADADVTILDPEAAWRVDSEKFFSKARNCPWDGQELIGRASATIVGGRVVYHEQRILV
jgi:dihydroorotase